MQTGKLYMRYLRQIEPTFQGKTRNAHSQSKADEKIHNDFFHGI